MVIRLATDGKPYFPYIKGSLETVSTYTQYANSILHGGELFVGVTHNKNGERCSSVANLLNNLRS